MNPHRTINAGITVLCTLILALLLSASYLLDGPDHSSEWAESSELKAAQADAARDTRKQAAAQALCASEHGPQSEARWTEDGSSVCTVRRGLKPLLVAGGSL